MKLILAFILPILFSSAARAQAPAGEYMLDGALSESVNVAIDRGTSNLSFIIKPIARKRLRATNPDLQTLVIRNVGDSIDVIVNDDVALRTAPGAEFTWKGFKGEPIEVTTSLVEGVLTNTFTAPDGVKVNRYRLRGDGLLELRVRMTSKRLKQPIEYTQVFRRKS